MPSHLTLVSHLSLQHGLKRAPSELFYSTEKTINNDNKHKIQMENIHWTDQARETINQGEA